MVSSVQQQHRCLQSTLYTLQTHARDQCSMMSAALRMGGNVRVPQSLAVLFGQDGGSLGGEPQAGNSASRCERALVHGREIEAFPLSPDGG